MVEFIKYCWLVLSIAFSGAWAIANGVSFVLSILFGILVKKYPPKEPIMKELIWKIPLGIFIVLLIISVAIVAPYRIYQDQQRQISDFKKQIPNVDTKQEIRNFLDSINSEINPEILHKIDEGQKEIPVFISEPEERKLAALATYLNFYNFLSFQKDSDNGYIRVPNELPSKNSPHPKEIDLRPSLYKYYLYPKDALIK